MDYQTETLEDLKRFEEDINTELALERLSRNPDFKKIILEGYLHDLVLELLYSKSDDSNGYYQKLDSIKFLKEYLDTIKLKAAYARNSKVEYEEEFKNTK